MSPPHATLHRCLQVAGLFSGADGEPAAYTYTDAVLAFRGAMIDVGSMEELVDETESVDTETTRTTATKGNARVNAVSGLRVPAERLLSFVGFLEALVRLVSVSIKWTGGEVRRRGGEVSPLERERSQPSPTQPTHPPTRTTPPTHVASLPSPPNPHTHPTPHHGGG